MLPALAAIFAAATIVCMAGATTYAAMQGWTPTAIAFALAMPPSIILSWQSGYYVAVGRLRTMNIQTALQALGTLLLLIVACVVFHAGTSGALAVWVLCTYACAAAVAIDAIREGRPLHRIELRARLSRIVRFGSQSSLNAGLGLLNYRIDSLILAALLGLASFGIYSIAVNLGEMLFLLLRPVNVAVGREIGASTHERSSQITADTIRLGFIIALAFSIAAFAFGPAVIQVAYGGRFGAASGPLRLLLPGILVFGSAGTFASFFIFQLGRPALVAWINGGMIAVQTTACFALVPRYGMAGAAVASSITYLIGAAANTVVFCRFSRLKVRDVWLPTVTDALRLWKVLARALHPRATVQPVPAADRGARFSDRGTAAMRHTI